MLQSVGSHDSKLDIVSVNRTLTCRPELDMASTHPITSSDFMTPKLDNVYINRTQPTDSFLLQSVGCHDSNLDIESVNRTLTCRPELDMASTHPMKSLDVMTPNLDNVSINRT